MQLDQFLTLCQNFILHPKNPTYISSLRRTPESLFGLEAFHSFRGRNEGGRVKPKLECISENVPDPCCVTPEEYYTTGRNCF